MTDVRSIVDELQEVQPQVNAKCVNLEIHTWRYTPEDTHLEIHTWRYTPVDTHLEIHAWRCAPGRSISIVFYEAVGPEGRLPSHFTRFRALKGRFPSYFTVPSENEAGPWGQIVPMVVCGTSSQSGMLPDSCRRRKLLAAGNHRFYKPYAMLMLMFI